MKFPRNSILVLIVLLTLTTGCIFGAKEYTISGKLTDQDGAPIAGADVIITGGTSTTATTAEDGTWSAKVKGTVTIKPSHEKYAFAPAEATVSQTAGDLNFTGTRLDSYDISGTVLDGKGQPIPNSKVVITGQVEKEVEVAADGKWSADVTGAVSVTAVADNYRFNTIAITETSTAVNIVAEYILLAHYSMDDTQGSSIADNSGNGYDATLIGNLTSVDGVADKAISFNGSDNYIKMPDNLLSNLSSEEVTISTWFKPTGTEIKWWTRIFSFGSTLDEASPETDTGIMFLTLRGNKPVGDGFEDDLIKFDFGAYQAEQFYQVYGGNTPATEQWYHVALTISDTTATIYLNGVAISSETPTANVSDLSLCDQNYIGRANSRWPDPLFNGLFDDFRIYDVSLTETEIAALYKANKPN